MRQEKRILCNFSFYDGAKIQRILEEMAEEGWMLQKPGNVMWKFRRTEPKQLRFCVTYFADGSQFDPAPTEGELTKIDFCEQDGWQLVTRWGAMQIFCNERQDAVPIETDPVMQVENIRRVMRKSVVVSRLCTIGLALYSLLLQAWQFRSDPVAYLSNPMQIYTPVLFLGILAESLYGLGSYVRWTRKARRAAEENGILLPVRSGVWGRYLFPLFMILWLLVVFGGSGRLLIFLLIWTMLLVIMGFCADCCKRWLKRRGVSRRKNMLISVSTVSVLTILCLLGAGAIMIKSGVDSRQDRHDDPMPLTVEDLTEAKGSWSRERRHHETVFLSRTQYDQWALGNGKQEMCDLHYTVIDVKRPFLRDYIRKAALNERQDEMYNGVLFVDHYVPADASVWGAEEVYQWYLNDGVVSTYLVFWENRIVRIDFDWNPSEMQIEKAARLLRES